MNNRLIKLLPLASAVGMALLTGCGGGGGETKQSAVTEPFYPEPENEWRLVWSDEFDGSSVDASNWSFQVGDGADVGLTRWGNNEQQWYPEDNATVENGNLVISARNEQLVDGFPYTSARLRSLGKMDFTYGRVEARIKAPAGQGLWSAFWMLPSESPYGGWASGGEIDIMEAVNQGTDNSVVSGTMHHGFAWPLNQLTTTQQDIDASSDYHVFAVEWEENEIRWFIDDTHYKTVTSDTWYSVYYDEVSKDYTVGAGSAPFNTDFHILLNLAVGGNLAGEVDASSVPGELMVDYVRVYECSYDLADGSGCNSNKDRYLDADPAQEPFTNSYSLYSDGPATLSWKIGGEEYTRELAASVLWPGIDNNAMLSHMEDGERGSIIDFTTTDMGNMGLYASDGDVFELYGFGTSAEWWKLHAGILSFDLYIDSANTNPDSQLLVKMDSGWPKLGQVIFNVADLPHDQWTTVKVKVNDLLANPGDQPLDTSSILNIFVLESNSAAHVMVDNIALSCTVPGKDGCGIAGPALDTDAVDPGGVPDLAGTWRVKAEVGSLGVGPAPGNTEWWSLGSADVGTRACFLDDEYVFNPDGTFENILGDETFLEPWQSGAGEVCGSPVAPHDGAFAGEWSWDKAAGAFTLTGAGSFVGLPKAVNEGELPNVAVPTSRTYNISFADAANATVTIESGTGVWWTFELVKTANAPGSDAPAGDTNYGVADFSGAFGGATVADDVYTFPAGAEVWAGFANNNAGLYPMLFENGGKLTFTAGIPDGGVPTQVRFVFENAPYPDVDPNFSTANVYVEGGEAAYEVEIPAQAAGQTFSSFLLYVVETDQPVIVKDVQVIGYAPAAEPIVSDPADFSGAFGGATVADNVYTFPSGAEAWAGFANNNGDIYPFNFPKGGQVQFTAAIPAGGSDYTGVRFVFENAPYPDVDPNFSTETVSIVGSAETTYTLDIPAQAAEQTFSSFLMYVVEQDQPVLIKDVVVLTAQ